MKSNESIEKDMKLYVKSIGECETKEEAIALKKEIMSYFQNNEVPPELNYILLSGYGEMLEMLATS